ncbi:LysR substrate-binding domain-containing protein [Microbacterium terregens]|uniref:LysR substrate-binding domain-containing protein n=1 Tax=Microbacterium terregens TaxID=69363 RepID=A0ABV5T222_9MICO
MTTSGRAALGAADFSLRQLQYFVTTAEEGSVTAAAELLYVSPTAVSLSLTQLEKLLGTELLIRRRAHGAALTPLGESLLPHARAVLAAASRLVDEVGVGGELRGSVAVGCFPSMGPTMLPTIIHTFLVDHPAVRVRFNEDHSDRLETDAQTGRIDLLLSYDIGLSDDLEKTALGQLRVGVLLPAGHWAADPLVDVDLARLAREPYVALQSQTSDAHFTRIWRTTGITPPEVRYSSENFETVRSMVGRGLGWSITMQRPRSPLSHEGLAVVTRDLPDGIVDPVDVVVAWRASATLSRPARALRDMIVRDGSRYVS